MLLIYTFRHLFLRLCAYPFVKKGAKPFSKRTFLHVEGLNLSTGWLVEVEQARQAEADKVRQSCAEREAWMLGHWAVLNAVVSVFFQWCFAGGCEGFYGALFHGTAGEIPKVFFEWCARQGTTDERTWRVLHSEVQMHGYDKPHCLSSLSNVFVPRGSHFQHAKIPEIRQAGNFLRPFVKQGTESSRKRIGRS